MRLRRRVVRIRLPPLAAFVACLALTGAGCGPRGPEGHPVTGTVTFRGAAVPGAEVVFDGAENHAFLSATADDAGRYTTAPLPGGGLPAGEYRVAVQPPLVEMEIDVERPQPPPPPAAFPAVAERLFDPVASGLSLTVPAGGTTFDIDLTPFAASP